MQPLKRFTQCGSLTMLITVFIVLFGVSSTALTTFGKSPNPPPPPPTPPPARARDCVTHIDCSSIPSTSCVRDTDDRLRCLCGNNKAPINGQCSLTKKELRHQCVDNDQCDIEMICLAENATKSTGFGRNPNAISASKICLCDEENGYKEDVDDNHCNGAVRMLAGVMVPFVSLMCGLLLSTKNLH